ncbi:MAG: murein DD-endopeptidase [Verrucomicrobiota bacterium]
MRAARDPSPGSTGRWPVVRGSLPRTIGVHAADEARIRGCVSRKNAFGEAAKCYGPTACAPQKQKNRVHGFIVVFALLLWSNLSMLGQSQLVDLALPTDNDALFRGDGPAFYQYIERDYQGEKSTPWEGGQYGFVRDPKQTGAGLVYTRFHEGIDIRALQRDAQGEPLDEIRAIADGTVVHTNPVPGYSNYGKYIVIEHRWDGSPYYSLYGHLSSIAVQNGQRVTKGERIAVMGYTGTGINRERAHVHLELNLMLNRHFESWHDTLFKNDPNHNGIYNGINLTGLNIAKLYLMLHKNPSLTLPDFFAGEETFYKVAVPNSSNFELPKRYPWMVKRSGEGDSAESWEVSFARTGLPLKIEPSAKRVSQPELTYAKKSDVDCSYLTHDFVAGRGKRAHLTESGLRFMRLLAWPE